MMRGVALALLLLSPLAWAEALEGKIWDLKQEQFLTAEMLFERLPTGGWLLLGEQHDHPQHHEIQAQWLKQLAQRQQLGAVALEMADHSQQPALDAARGRGQTITPEAIQWKQGWDWALYESVVRTALDVSMQVVATDLTRDTQRQAYREGAPKGELETEHADFMRDLLHESHCGQMPTSGLDGMRQVQLARDQAMAEQLDKHAIAGRIGVMLTGGIHARRDLGIPRWQQSPLVSVLMISVEDGKEQPEDYIPKGLSGYTPVDYLLFTDAIPERDYCAELTARHPSKSGTQ